MTTDADARFWDAMAERYAKKPLPDPAATARKLDIIKGLLRPTDRLLDVGCGTGTIALELAPHVAEAHGVDLSTGMIAIAERKAADAEVGNATFHVRPAGTLETFADAQFDLVCAFNLLHLVADPAALARAIYRVTAPGGAFVSSTPCLGGWFPPWGLLLPALHLIGKAPPVTRFTAAQLHATLAEAGFTAVQAHDVGGSARDVFVTARRPR